MAASTISVFSSCVGSLVTAKAVQAPSGRQFARVTLAAPFLRGCGSLSVDAAASSISSPVSAATRKFAIVASTAAEADAPVEAAVSGSTKLYVGNLPWTTQSKELAAVFHDVGNVELVEVIFDRELQRSRGFAFVTMSTAEEAQRAIDMFDGSELDGRTIRVSFPQVRERSNDRADRPPRRDFNPRSSTDSENKLFVGNLSWGVNDSDLDELFNRHGSVQEARVVRDRDTGRSKGFGFVTFSKQEDALQAIQALHGAEFDGRILRVNPAGDKPERRDGGRY
ncbi:hypothetical protein R1flu_006077 [Riccia fluitans]|uniref:RRM domain-containing protein n=1 Tax=Riccia fluitans TaxID=41844 RepID=A0ABD1YVR8_9MARC